MPTRRSSPATDRSAPSRAVVKKSTPVGCLCRLPLLSPNNPGIVILGPVVRLGGSRRL